MHADQADKHTLYEESVQHAPDDRIFIEGAFSELFSKAPVSLREDFCGTAWLTCDWVQSSPERFAVGVDRDAAVLAWGKDHHLEELTREERVRVQLLNDDVLTVKTDQVDVIAALNFSYWVLKQRSLMLEYFRRAYQALNQEGILVLDLFGGMEAGDVKEELREDDEYTYCWDQEAYNPITGDFLTKIHFHFPDGSRLQDAFVYDWRLWRTPELTDVLLEAGFTEVKFYLREADDDGNLTGESTATSELDDDLVWLAYLVGVKR
jgi:SAM-dependent methyltransferase